MKELQKETKFESELIEVVMSNESHKRLMDENEQMIFTDYVWENTEQVAVKVIVKVGRLPYINESLMSIAEYNSQVEI